jgi:glucose-6-phosphate isomerase, archaeal
MEIDLTKLTPAVRKLSDMREVICDKEWLQTAADSDLYFMYRKVEQENGLNRNITIIPARMLGNEFIKTAGHVHTGPQQEIYTVLEGQAIFLMQKTNGETVEDVYAVKAGAGESAIIPSNYGHVTINPSGKDLKTEDWSSETTKSDYSLFQKLQGACYYYTKEGWVKNENYKNVPELRFEEPLKTPPENLDFLK